MQANQPTHSAADYFEQGWQVAHRDTAAVARFLAKRRCLRRSAISSIVSKSGASFLRLARRCSLAAEPLVAAAVRVSDATAPDEVVWPDLWIRRRTTRLASGCIIAAAGRKKAAVTIPACAQTLQHPLQHQHREGNAYTSNQTSNVQSWLPKPRQKKSFYEAKQVLATGAKYRSPQAC